MDDNSTLSQLNFFCRLFPFIYAYKTRKERGARWEFSVAVEEFVANYPVQIELMLMKVCVPGDPG